MNWVQRKIYLYNVTFGLFMLDWWERYLFNILVIVLMWFIFYNGSRYVTDFCKRSSIASNFPLSGMKTKLLSLCILHSAYLLIRLTFKSFSFAPRVNPGNVNGSQGKKR